MSILDQAIQIEGGISKLAKALDLHRNNITNWRARGIPKGWETALRLRYQRRAKKMSQESCVHALDSVAQV